MIEEEEDSTGILTKKILAANEWIPRIAGVITFLSSLCMVWMAWNRRRRLFHRLVLAMSLHSLVLGLFFMYGTEAIPCSELDSPLGCSGTIATCTAQGFFLYVTMMTAFFYYGSFSVYSYVGVLNNFKKSKISWLENYIHILVHMYPIISAFYILSCQGFNDFGMGFCFLYGSPMVCWLDPSIPCKRGPESRLMILFFIIPTLLVLLFPSTVIAILFVKVRKRQENIFINAKSIAKQGVVYLVPVYWTLVPFLIGSILASFDFKGIIDSQRISPFYILVLLIYCSFALWAMFSYLYFSVEKKTIPTTDTGNDHKNKNNATEIPMENGMNSDNMELKPNQGFIFTIQEIGIQDTSHRLTTTATAKESLAQEPRYSFNIFYGTDASGAFASFIHDGDSDDEKVDNTMTDHWASVQDHV